MGHRALVVNLSVESTNVTSEAGDVPLKPHKCRLRRLWEFRMPWRSLTRWRKWHPKWLRRWRSWKRWVTEAEVVEPEPMEVGGMREENEKWTFDGVGCGTKVDSSRASQHLYSAVQAAQHFSQSKIELLENQAFYRWENDWRPQPASLFYKDTVEFNCKFQKIQ